MEIEFEGKIEKTNHFPSTPPRPSGRRVKKGRKRERHAKDPVELVEFGNPVSLCYSVNPLTSLFLVPPMPRDAEKKKGR